jgi:hypothetical protein
MAQRAINPRRITPQPTQKRPVQQEIRSALAAATITHRPATQDEDAPDNIFANI